MLVKVRQGVRIRDNVTAILTDIVTGAQRVFSGHNIATDYAFSAIANWIGGKNNYGYQPVSPPTQCQLGSGTGTPSSSDTGLFAPIAGTLVTVSYTQPNTPTNGTTTFVFQIPAGIVQVEVTEAIICDVSSNTWFHTMFPAPFTPASSEMITIQWEVTFSN